MIDFLQWAGCATGVAGASLLALNTKHSGWGFVLFLISNGFWTAFGFQTEAPGLVTTQLVFTATGATARTGATAFLYDLVPQGRGRQYLLGKLKLHDSDGLEAALLLHGAFGPIGALRDASAVWLTHEMILFGYHVDCKTMVKCG